MKIVLLEANSLGKNIDLSPIQNLGNYVQYNETESKDILPRITDATIVIVNKIELTREIIEQCNHLKLICVSATGTNNINHNAAKEHNITVKNVKGYSTDSVTQITWGLILQLINKINYFDQYVKSGEYCNSPMFTDFGRLFKELHTLQIGIIGLGNIGERVAEIAESFKMKIAFHSPSGKREHHQYIKMSLDEILKTSDIITIHTPLNEFTSNLIGEKELRLMQKNAIIINAARGGIINEEALKNALDDNIIGGAAIDVYTKEPIIKNNPLLNVKNKEKLILTPHIAWASEEARATLVNEVAQNIKNFIELNNN